MQKYYIMQLCMRLVLYFQGTCRSSDRGFFGCVCVDSHHLQGNGCVDVIIIWCYGFYYSFQLTYMA